MKRSGGCKRSPQSPGRKNPSVPRANQQRSSSNSRDRRCSTPTSKCRASRSPSTSSKRSCGKPATPTARKTLSPVRGASTTRKVTVTSVKPKKQVKNTKPPLRPGKTTQTTSSLMYGEHKIFALDPSREIEHILASDAKSREEVDVALTLSGDVRIPSTDPPRTEPQFDQREDMLCVPPIMLSQVSNRIPSRENECGGIPSNAPKQSTEITKDIDDNQLLPPTNVDPDGNTLDIHIASLRNLVQVKNLQNDDFSIVSQLKGNSVISTGEGRVTISTGDKRITISSVEGRQAALKSDGSRSIGEQSNFSTDASVYSQPVPEANVRTSSHVKRKVSTIIIESHGPCYSNNEEETREHIIRNDPSHPLARKTLSSPGRSEIPSEKRPATQLPINDHVTPAVYAVHAQDEYKPKTLQTFTSYERDHNSPPRTTPETTVSDVSKFVLEVDLNKSITNPECTNSVKSKFAVSSIRSQLGSGMNTGWPSEEETESKTEKVRGPVTNNPTVCKSPVDVKLKVSNQDPQFSTTCDQSMSQRSYKPLPLITSENKPPPPVSATWKVSKSTNNSKITSGQDILQARETVVPNLNETHSIKDIDQFKKDTYKSEDSPSKKIWESKEISDKSKTKLNYDIWETREEEILQNNNAYPLKAIGCNFDSTVKNIFTRTSMGSPNGNLRTRSPTRTSDFQNFSGNIVNIVQENKENEIHKGYTDFNHSTVGNHRNKGERNPYTIGSNTFSTNDIIIPECDEVNETLPQSKHSNKNIRMGKEASEKTIESYITVKESKSYTVSEKETKNKNYSTDHVARRQYFDVKGIFGGESGQRLDTVNVTNDSRRLEVQNERGQELRKPSGGTDYKSEVKQWEDADEIQINLTKMSLNQMSQVESSDWVTNDDNVQNLEIIEELDNTNPDDVS